MFNFLHTNIPEPLLLDLGFLKIHWYGLFIVLGILAAVIVALKLAEKYEVKKELVIDSIFYLIIFGVIGARIYHILLEFSYYQEYPLDMFKIWNGGIAIHGAIIVSFFTVWFFAKKKNFDLWLLLAIYSPALALGQAIGRWGNYFNQELYGLPTDLAWGIPIEFKNRMLEYFSYEYFHPTFLYESIGNLIIFLALIIIHYFAIKKKKISYKYIFFIYLIFYSLLRFFLEFIRIDKTPEILGLRMPQIISLALIIISAVFIIYCYLFNLRNQSLEKKIKS